MKTYMSVYLDESLVEKIDQASQLVDRARNYVVVKALEEYFSKEQKGVKRKSK